jgi:predicted transcriptional regulator
MTEPMASPRPRHMELERTRLTREALDDVDAGRLVEHADVEAWADQVTRGARAPRRPRRR